MVEVPSFRCPPGIDFDQPLCLSFLWFGLSSFYFWPPTTLQHAYAEVRRAVTSKAAQQGVGDRRKGGTSERRRHNYYETHDPEKIPSPTEPRVKEGWWVAYPSPAAFVYRYKCVCSPPSPSTTSAAECRSFNRGLYSCDPYLPGAILLSFLFPFLSLLPSIHGFSGQPSWPFLTRLEHGEPSEQTYDFVLWNTFFNLVQPLRYRRVMHPFLAVSGTLFSVLIFLICDVVLLSVVMRWLRWRSSN